MQRIKNKLKFFYCSFDVRGRSFAKALLWSDSNSFGSRAYFLTVSRPAGLNVDNVHLDDEGVSVCFVLFFGSPPPTFNFFSTSLHNRLHFNTLIYSF